MDRAVYIYWPAPLFGSLDRTVGKYNTRSPRDTTLLNTTRRTAHTRTSLGDRHQNHHDETDTDSTDGKRGRNERNSHTHIYIYIIKISVCTEKVCVCACVYVCVCTNRIQTVYIIISSAHFFISLCKTPRRLVVYGTRLEIVGVYM